jgi:hypothetical protein
MPPKESTLKRRNARHTKKDIFGEADGRDKD